MPLFTDFPRHLAWLALTGLLTGCASQGAKPVPPRFDSEARFSVAIDRVATQQPWWRTALPEELQAQIEALLRDNPAIRIAAQDVAISHARLDQAEAARWPDVGGSAGSRWQSSDGSRSDSHSIGIDAQLPLDLFGRLAATRDAAAHDLAQSLAELEQQRLPQVRDSLLTTIDAAESAQLLQLLDEQIDTAKTLLRLTEFRFSQGLVSSVDVLQQREQLATLEQQPSEIALRLRTALSRLDELRGQLPASDAHPPAALPAMQSDFAVARPAQLLQRRPDLIARRAALQADDQRYEAALRERLPEASLSGNALLQLASGNPSAVLGAALDASLSLFDSGRLNAQIAARRASLERAGITYLQAWLAAVRETDDLLNRLQSNRERLDRSARLTRLEEDLFEAARRRYARGIGDYLPVLAAVRTLQQQQRDHLALQAERLRIIVRLHSAMGLPGAIGEKS